MTAADTLAVQCGEASTRCLYTSTSLFLWVRQLRLIRIVFVVLPIVLGSLAGWKLLQADKAASHLVAVCAFLAGLIPAIYTALKLDDHLPIAARLAGEYKNLEIIFRDLQKIGPHQPFEEFHSDYLNARSRLEKANAEAYTAPEHCFWFAKRKIKKRQDYRFDQPPKL